MSQEQEQHDADAKANTLPPIDRPSAMPQLGGNNGNDRAKASEKDLVAQLKQRVHETRLPADLKQQILADEPPAEVLERLYRELQEEGGLSAEEFFASLGLDVEPQP
jgi:hypothetical protein